MDPQPHTQQELRFTGDGATYFGIWIVNLLLTIVTLGIYSPWAKVRRLKYLYGNTLLDGSPFGYHGSPVALLKGRIVGVVLLVAYSQTAKISFSLWLVVVALIAIALPWILWKSQLFRLRNSSYRGIRFGFDGTLTQSYLTFGLPMLLFIAPYFVLGYMGMQGKFTAAPTPQAFIPLALVVLASMALSPWLYLRIKRFQHGHARLGTTPFAFTATVPGVYGLSLVLFGLGFLVVIVSLILGAVAGFVAAALAHFIPVPGIAASAAAGVSANQMIGIVAGTFVGYASLSCIYPIAGALRQNFIWGNTRLGEVPLQSQASAGKLVQIHIVNAFLVIITLGLYWPFAVIRTLRYQLGTISWSGDPAQVVANAADAGVTAVGEEAAEILGFDLAL